MTQVRPGDVIFHLTDNRAITDVSIVVESADDSFNGVEGTDWADQPGYRIGLRDHMKLDPPLPREGFLAEEPFATELRELAQRTGRRGGRGAVVRSRNPYRDCAAAARILVRRAR